LFGFGIAASLQKIHQQALRDYTPLVNDIIRVGSRDGLLIEHTLDGLLDFCGNPNALELFRRLCRHYYFLNPQAAAEYVQAYRAAWDPPANPHRASESDPMADAKPPKSSKKQ
jgi:hypothetical protein